MLHIFFKLHRAIHAGKKRVLVAALAENLDPQTQVVLDDIIQSALPSSYG